MELLHYLRVLRRRWVLVAASVLLALTAAALATARMPARYAATVTMIVTVPDAGANATAAYQAVLSSQERAKSYAKLIQSRTVAERVAKSLGGGMTSDEIRPRISAEVLPETVLLRATVTDESPALAMRIGHAVGTEFARYVDGLERPTPSARPGGRVAVADDADLPAVPVSPRPLLNLGLGLVIGLIVGAVAAVLRDLTDTSLRSTRTLREAAGGAPLGVVGHDRRLDERIVAPAGSPRAEEFRLIRANLRFCGDEPPRSVVVTGAAATASEGGSLVAYNLAVALADTGWRVVLVDAAPFGAGMAARLGIPEETGLATVLAQNRPVGEVLRQWGPDSLSVLPAGPAYPGELLASSRTASVIGELEERADIVIIDAPPVLTCVDTAVLARRCTGALLVARYGRTRREEVAEAAERLRTVHAQVLGSVLTSVPPAGRGPFTLPRLPELVRRGLAAQR